MSVSLREFSAALRQSGFDLSADSRAGGERVVLWTRCEPDGIRKIDLQLWGDGQHRVTHWIGGRMTTAPTGFTSVAGMLSAINFECTRTDNKAISGAAP